MLHGLGDRLGIIGHVAIAKRSSAGGGLPFFFCWADAGRADHFMADLATLMGSLPVMLKVSMFAFFFFFDCIEGF